MDSSEQMVDADPHGDVSFLIGDPDNANTLRVSSKVLSLASPVFAALFNPKYSEGIALSNSTKVPQIALPDDDPEALILICHALHHQRITPLQISFKLLGKATVICDKYDLARVLTPWSGLWMQQWKTRGGGSAYWSKMLCLSSIFDSHETFYLSSEKLMTSCSAVEPSTEKEKKKKKKKKKKRRDLGHADDPSSCLDKCVSSTSKGVYRIAGVPEHLYRMFSKSVPGNLTNELRRYQGSILYKREAVKCELQQIIEEILDDAVNEEEYAQDAYRFLKALKRLNLWPLSKRLRSSTLQEILKDLRRFSRLQGPADCKCEYYFSEDIVEDAADDVEIELKGLCLTCFKKGRATWEEGNCSAAEVCQIV